MSIQMSTARTYLRIARKPRDNRNDYVRLQRQNTPLPQAKVAQSHRVEELTVEGARAVWLRTPTPKACIVYLHGGSYITGPHAEQWEWASWLARNCHVDVLVVDYRLAPQHRFPAGFDDALRIVRSLQDADQLSATQPWILAGDSAGGGLALATAHALRDEGRALPDGVLLVSPWVDLRAERSYANAAQDPWLTVDGLRASASAYAGEYPLTNVGISPLANSQRGLPPVYIDAAADDILVFEGRELRDTLTAAEGTVTYNEIHGAFHDYPLVGWIPEAKRARARQAAWIDSIVSPR